MMVMMMMVMMMMMVVMMIARTGPQQTDIRSAPPGLVRLTLRPQRIDDGFVTSAFVNSVEMSALVNLDLD